MVPHVGVARHCGLVSGARQGSKWQHCVALGGVLHGAVQRNRGARQGVRSERRGEERKGVDAVHARARQCALSALEGYDAVAKFINACTLIKRLHIDVVFSRKFVD